MCVMFLSKSATLIVRLKVVFRKQKKERQQWLLSDKNRQVQNRTSQKKSVKGCKK